MCEVGRVTVYVAHINCVCVCVCSVEVLSGICTTSVCVCVCVCVCMQHGLRVCARVFVKYVCSRTAYYYHYYYTDVMYTGALCTGACTRVCVCTIKVVRPTVMITVSTHIIIH